MVKGGDPTYYAEPGETVEEAAKAAVETYRLPFVSHGGKKLAIKAGESAATVAARFAADAKGPGEK
jgi:predicted rRNA methylase YqxC with S4 and FtsJ domains